MKVKISLAIVAAVLATAAPTHAAPPQPVVEVQADCASGLTITTSGYPEGASGMFTIGSEAPRRLTLNGSVHADWPVSIDVFDYVVMAVPGDGQTVTGTVDCHVEVAEPVVVPVVRERHEVVPEPNYAIPSEPVI